jgi:GAF domain-containing protein
MERRNPLHFLQVEVSRLRDENRDLKEELAVLRSSVRALSALQDILQHLTPDADVIKLLDDVLVSALAVVDAEDGSLLLTDDDTGELVFAVVHGEARQRLTGFRLPKGVGIAGWVATSKQAQVVRDVHMDAHFSPEVDETIGFHTHSLACVPLIEGDRVLGVIEALNKSSGAEFTEQDQDLLRVVAQLAAIAIVRAEAYLEQATDK